MYYNELENGFNWGSATVRRVKEDEKSGRVVLELETEKHSGTKAIQIEVTKTGKINITGRNNRGQNVTYTPGGDS